MNSCHVMDKSDKNLRQDFLITDLMKVYKRYYIIWLKNKNNKRLENNVKCNDRSLR